MEIQITVKVGETVAYHDTYICTEEFNGTVDELHYCITNGIKFERYNENENEN